jgi:Sporulation and spore germination
MNRTAAKVILALLALIVIGGGIWLISSRGGKRGLSGVIDTLTGAPPPGTERITVSLYFPGPGEYLIPERRVLDVTPDVRDRVRKIVQAVLDGPQQGDLGRSFPEEVTVGGVLLGGDGTAYVDLHSETLLDPPSSGSLAEMQRVFSLVDSIALNVEQVTRVALLWNGVQRESFGGHLDTSRPFVADRSMLAP